MLCSMHTKLCSSYCETFIKLLLICCICTELRVLKDAECLDVQTVVRRRVYQHQVIPQFTAEKKLSPKMCKASTVEPLATDHVSK